MLELDPLTFPKGYVGGKPPRRRRAGSSIHAPLVWGASAGAYSGFTFVLQDALPYPTDFTAGPYFLIIAPQAVIDAGRCGISSTSNTVWASWSRWPALNRLARVRLTSL